jgi:hypothetical protein
MDTFQSTEKELNKMLSNSMLVKLHPPLDRTILTRVFKRPNGEYTSVFERTTTEPAPPPLEYAAAFSAEPPTAPALATQPPPTTPPAASPTGFWPLAQTAGSASAALAPAPHPNSRAATQLAAPTQPLAVAFAAQDERDDEVDDGSPNQELHALPQPPQRLCNNKGCTTPLNLPGTLAARIAANGHAPQRFCAQHNYLSRQRDAAPRAQGGATDHEDNPTYRRVHTSRPSKCTRATAYCGRAEQLHCGLEVKVEVLLYHIN